MHFDEQSKPAYVKMIRAKLGGQMSERAERIGSFSDDKIIKMHEKWRQLFVEGFAPNIGKREAATPIGARSFSSGG